MADKFDPYREALVVETATVWPDDYLNWDPGRRQQAEAQLHAQPDKAGNLEYVRVHTGFCRQITVTPADIQRLKP